MLLHHREPTITRARAAINRHLQGRMRPPLVICIESYTTQLHDSSMSVGVEQLRGVSIR
jgi:hypothetical protein